MRDAFEKWFSDDGAWAKAVDRNARGEYVLAQAATSWRAWQAAWGAAPPPVAGIAKTLPELGEAIVQGQKSPKVMQGPPPDLAGAPVRFAAPMWEEYDQLRAAAVQALDALECCYDVTAYPGNGRSRQDMAIAALKKAGV